MRDELEKELEIFPFMKKGKSFSEQKNEGYIDDLYSAFGLECDDGWYNLIYNLCSEIMDEYKKTGRPMDLVVDQIKEKYGTLRFYYHFEGGVKGTQGIDLINGDGIKSIRMTPQADDFESKISDIVSRYEEKSGYICERCGVEAVLRTDLGYIRTLCDKHYKDVLNDWI